MKLVTAVVDPEAINLVRAALRASGVEQPTISPASGCQRRQTAIYRGTEHVIDVHPMTRVEVVCDLFDAEAIARAVMTAASGAKWLATTVWIAELDLVMCCAPDSSGVTR